MTKKVDLFDIKYNLDVVIERQIEGEPVALQNAKNQLFELLKVYIVEEAKRRLKTRIMCEAGIK